MTKMNLRRRTEDVDYWRKQAGWYDDDISMQEYNQGVVGTYDDDNYQSSSSASSGTSSEGTQLVGGSNGLATVLKIGAFILSLVFFTLLYRAISRRATTSRKVSATKTGTADTKGRTRSRSRSSRSRSRSRRHGTSGTNYELMDEKSDRSKKSSRSRSRSRRRSKSKSRRSASKSSRSKKDSSKEVLV